MLTIGHLYTMRKLVVVVEEGGELYHPSISVFDSFLNYFCYLLQKQLDAIGKLIIVDIFTEEMLTDLKEPD